MKFFSNIILSTIVTSGIDAFSPLHSYRSTQSALYSTEASSDVFTVTVALTREDGKNDKLKKSISTHPTIKMLENSMNLNLVEMSLIEHADGPDLEKFQELAKEDPSLSNYDYVVITSPESAKVFGKEFDAENLSTKIAAVGKATKSALTKLGFEVDFVPSKANGETLADELPPVKEMALNNVLYPASDKAAETIQDMLDKRKDASFRVERLNTYDTVPVEYDDDQIKVAIDDVQISCFGSPTAVDAWIKNVDRALNIEDMDEEEKKKVPGCNGNVVAVCIGTTTAQRCLESGRWHANDIYYPATNPGLDGWTDSIFQASGDVMEKCFWGDDGW